MAFIVEDGTGLANATSYVSVADADTHFTDRGNTVWTGATVTVKEVALVKATDYVEKRFGPKFRGFRESKQQSLEWPRLNAFDNDDFLYSDVDRIPRNLKRGIIEYALLALELGTLLPVPARGFTILDPATGLISSEGSGQVTGKKEKVGLIEESTTFANTVNSLSQSKPLATQSGLVSSINLPEYPVADEWLRELLNPGFSGDLARA